MDGCRNKVVAITGASGGIGEATALRLGTEGARLVLGACGRGSAAGAGGAIEAAGAEVVFRPTDVTRREQVDALVALAASRFGRLDVMVNNAGSARSPRSTSCASRSGTG